MLLRDNAHFVKMFSYPILLPPGQTYSMELLQE